MKKRIATLICCLGIVTVMVGSTGSWNASATVPGINSLVSQSSSGIYQNGTFQAGNGSPNGPILSGNGRYVAFSSEASNLVASDTNGTQDVFVRDLSTNQTSLVSLNYAGAQGNVSSHALDITHDGRYVLFQTSSTNFGAGTSGANHLFLRDTIANSTQIADYVWSSNTGYYASVSDNGRFVIFNSKGSIVPNVNGNKQHVYVHDMVAGTYKALDVDSSGNGGNNDAFAGGISCSGNITAFSSNSTNLSGNSSGNRNLFIAESNWNGVILTNVTESIRASTVLGSVNADVQVSCDGNVILYGSTSGGYFKYNRITKANASIPGAGGSGVTMSGNGRYISLKTSAALDPAYPNAGTGTKNDIYVVDTKNNTTELVTFTVSGDRSRRVPSNDALISMDEDGSQVAFWYETPPSTDPGNALISGLTSGGAAAQADVYVSKTGHN